MKFNTKLKRNSTWCILLLLCVSLHAQMDTTFKLCEPSRKNPYYYPDLTYRGEFRELKSYYYQYFGDENFKKLVNNSGIVRLQFQVNCKGESGHFSFQNCDFNYKTCLIDETITTQLLNLTKSLNGWIPAKNEKGDYVNSHKFFAFKIKEGQLIDILPK
jgi:hypothetical protein